MVKSHIAEQLFKKEDLNFDSPQSIPALSLQIGMKETIYGTIKKQGLSMIDYDLLFIREPQDLFADNNPFVSNLYSGSPGTDITKLTNRINALYQKELHQKIKYVHPVMPKGEDLSRSTANLHLRPKTEVTRLISLRGLLVFFRS
jgi:putative ABC transport system permease protein